jgi:hypothetical protein
MREIDFAGFREVAKASFRPDFAAVQRAARRRRGGLAAGAGVAVATVAAVLGVVVTGLPGSPPADWGDPSPSPSPTPGFVRPALPSPRGPAEQDGIKNGPLIAGDVDHLYGRYYDCVDDTCSVGVAASADRGRTWRKSPIPVPVDSYAVLYPVGPRALVAHVQTPPPLNRDSQRWLASVDGGVTWRRVTASAAPAIPAGWRVLMTGRELEDLLAADSATGDMVRVRAGHGLQMARWVAGAPAGAGIWVSGFTRTKVGADGRLIPSGAAVAVSRDAGRTWRRSTFPGDLGAFEDAGPAVATADGRTVYAVGQIGGRLAVFVSRDGGKTWRRTGATAAPVGARTVTAAVRPDGALLIQIGTVAQERPIMFVSPDRGQTLRSTEPGPGAGAVPVSGGFLQGNWPLGGDGWISTDGLTWSYIPTPKLS